MQCCIRLTVNSMCIALFVGAAQAQNSGDVPVGPAPPLVRTAADADSPLIQLAILLDNSGSMSGLIEQAKSELWRVVNELTAARHNGRQPRLQVALYTYGDPPPQRLNELTDDLDAISESLFAVTISGGTEHCGQVIQTATRELHWSENSRDLKLIFIAGNEPFTQGPIDYRMACKEAIEKGIIVNTIHCGDGIPDDWRDGALLADGRSISINHNTRLVDIEAPQDREIARLGAELNRTYLPFGQAGTANQARQVAQDSNAAGQSLGSAVQRAVSKANAFYSNRSWDLVDAIREGQVQLANVKTEDLPENLRALTPVQRQAFVDGKAAERNRVQQRINELNGQRNQFVAAKRKELANAPGQETLDQALVQTIRSQALRKSYIFEGASK